MVKECDNCGAEVSNDYHRVLSVDGKLPHCPDCSRLTDRIRPTEEGGFSDT